jgi:hypothetical protein
MCSFDDGFVDGGMAVLQIRIRVKVFLPIERGK